MRSRILKSMLLIAASATISAITSGDAVSAARRQSAVVWLKEPTLIVSTIVEGPVIFTHDDAPQLIAQSNFEIGGQASVAAGPVGTSAGANTDFKKGSAIYSYSTKGAGLFAGVSLAGSDVHVDNKGNRTAYPEGIVPMDSDKSPQVSALLKTAAGPKTPAIVKPFTDALQERIGSAR